MTNGRVKVYFWFWALVLARNTSMQTEWFLYPKDEYNFTYASSILFKNIIWVNKTYRKSNGVENA